MNIHLFCGSLIIFYACSYMIRSVGLVAVEAIVIGILNVIFISILKSLSLLKSLKTHMNEDISHYIEYMLAGILIHVGFEYTGGNQKWCIETYKDLYKSI